MEFISNNKKDTREFAKKFLQTISKSKRIHASVIGLYGELGAGKTTFSQFFARELGVKRKVSSPTFVIMKRYPIKHKIFENLFHIDAYRLKKDQELLHLGFKEILKNSKNLILIEWPENVKKIMPKNHFKIKIKHLDNQKRSFKI